jgi:hypothetical protein
MCCPSLHPLPLHNIEKGTKGEEVGTESMVQFQKAAEKSPPPRFSGSEIHLESIGLHFLLGLTPGRRVFSFQEVLRMLKAAIQPVLPARRPLRTPAEAKIPAGDPSPARTARRDGAS